MAKDLFRRWGALPTLAGTDKELGEVLVEEVDSRGLQYLMGVGINCSRHGGRWTKFARMICLDLRKEILIIYEKL